MSEQSPKRLPPLGLPTGSVRALLTLLTIAVVVSNVARDREVDILWVEVLLIALAHYFTSRRFVKLPPDVLKRLENDGVLEKEHHPLFLPRHSIRTLVIGSFVGLGIYLYGEGRLTEPKSVSLLGIVGAYVLGNLVRGFNAWLVGKRDQESSRLWGDLKALVVLGGLLTIAVPELMAIDTPLPEEMQKVGLGLMLFYFGSR